MSSSPEVERRILDSWQPEPLVPDIELNEHKHVVVSSKPGKYITVNGVECLNFGTHNYLGLADHPRLERAALEAAKKYGVGSCGPRAFYGTMDVHLRLEEQLASFLNVQEAVLYSYGFSTIASAIPAYAKATDIIYMDEYCNFAIQQGVKSSRSKLITFKHNDVKDLEEKIIGSPNVRTFLIVEGIYARTGDICPLNEIIEIKKKYKIRLFVDESRSFGTLGLEGKGVVQHYDANVDDIDLIMVSLENALCAYGGFCAGSTYVIDHQRLAGTGYCFSASLPPLQAQVAAESLKIISEQPELIRNAQELSAYASEKLTGLTRLISISHSLSPIKILVIKRYSEQKSINVYNKEDELLLEEICAKILSDERMAVSVARCLSEDEIVCMAPAIRIVVNACLTCGDIDRLVGTLERLSSEMLNN